MTENSTYPETDPEGGHAVACRTTVGAYAYGPFTYPDDAAALCGELTEDLTVPDLAEPSVDVETLITVWQCRLKEPFELTRRERWVQGGLGPDGDHAGPVEQSRSADLVYGPRVQGYVVDLYARGETGGQVWGPFADRLEAAEWWERQREVFKPGTRAVVMPLVTPKDQ
jgi:hypothetical protein